MWTRLNIALPMLWAAVACCCYELLDLHWLALPWLPISAVGVAVAFYLGFKNNASYGRLWEARKIWGSIVNASRAWAFSARDLVTDRDCSEPIDAGELALRRERLVLRHVAWLDALRHQLRQIKTWEHQGQVDEVLAQINPAARLIANQSRDLAELRAAGLLDG